MKHALTTLTTFTALLLAPLAALHAAEPPKGMPKQDVIVVPAIGTGLCVCNAFQTGMVLQRDKPLSIWGWASAGEKVTVSFSGQEVSATAAADRSWQLTLAPMAANRTPQTLTIKGKSTTLTLENILVGDVWILGGQSNMAFPISKVDDGEFEIVSANFPLVRLLAMPRGKGFDSVKSFERLFEWSDWSKRHFLRGDWEVCSPETVKDFSAIGYIFGRRLFMATGVPIGLIDTSIGGTTVETWTSEDAIRKIDGKETQSMFKQWTDKIASYDAKADLEQRLANYNKNIDKMKAKGEAPPTDLRPGPVADRNRPGSCYAGVIKPLSGLAVKGAVWHQGFNNCFNGSAGARMYYQVFGKMITSWRETFSDPKLPFCIISLCTADSPQTSEHFLRPMADAGPDIREAHYKTFRDFFDAGDKHIGFVSSFDLRKKFYHPQIKIPAGERAAKWALATEYNAFKSNESDDFWLPPAVKEFKVAGQTLQLTFSTEVRTKDEGDDRMIGFAIAGNDRRFFPAEANWFTSGEKDNRNRPVESRNILVLSSPFVAEPMHYRYAWARNPMANVANSRQVPLAAQRSDDWMLEETPVKFPVPPGMAEQDAAKASRSKNQKELELGDTERRILEAEATLANLKEKFTKDKQAWQARKAAEEEQMKAATGK